MTLIAIHQPNYLPWLGYFEKIRRADVFVFLDDCQFSKGSYTNRVRIGQGEWLTLPVSNSFGAAINETKIADPDWLEKHLARLEETYKKAKCFKQVWPDISGMLRTAAQLRHRRIRPPARHTAVAGKSATTETASATQAQPVRGLDAQCNGRACGWRGAPNRLLLRRRLEGKRPA